MVRDERCDQMPCTIMHIIATWSFSGFGEAPIKKFTVYPKGSR